MLLRRIVRRLTWRRKLDPKVVATVRGSGLFDARWYLTRYPEVRRFPLGPLAHFCEHGLRERLDPGPSFSTDAYLARVPEAAKLKEPPFLHAMRGRRPDTAYLWAPSTVDALRPVILRSGLFDAAHYLKHNPDVARTTSRPFEHYIRHGLPENRVPGPDFDPEFYAEQYPEYRRLFPTPIEHFVHYGRDRGHVGKGEPLYRRWVALHDTLTPEDEAAIRAEITGDPLPPVRIVHVVDAAAAAALPAILDGWRAQIGVNARAVVVPAADLHEPAWRDVAQALAHEPVARPVADLDRALGPGEDGIVLLASGAVIPAPHAAYVLARWLRARGAVAAYPDHDHLRDGERTAPAFKPGFSPEYLRRTPYAGPIAAFANAPAAQAALRAVLCAPLPPTVALPSRVLARLPPDAVARVPYVLAHVPLAEPTPAPLPVAAVEDPPLADPGAAAPSVSILVPTRDRVELLRACVASILDGTAYPPECREILILDNGSCEPETLAYFAELAQRPDVRVVAAPGPFNFSAINNAGAAASTADILVFLNNDTTVLRPDWLARLVAYARRPGTGAVGARLLYPDGTIQHGGAVLGVHGVAIHRLAGVAPDAVEAPDVTREMGAVTGACLAIRRALFLDLGGFDPSLEINFNDVKLCIQALRAGHRNLYLADALLTHHESTSRGYNDTPAKQRRINREGAYLCAQFAGVFRDDPAYDPNLSLVHLDQPAFPPRVVRPWRRRPEGSIRVLMLSITHGQGFGVPVVLARQAEALRRRGIEVIVGGPVSERDAAYPGCRRVALADARQAANFAVSEGVNAVIAHTQPFFSVARLVGDRPLTYAVDHGEPDSRLFPDAAAREAADREKRLSIAYARRVFAISRTIYGQGLRRDTIVTRNGNAHLATWTDGWSARRPALREAAGLADRFVALTVCRFEASERAYKGVDRTVEIAQEFGLLYPELKSTCVFALAGRGDPDDVALLEAEGLRVFPNVTDARMGELYAIADLSMSFSKWEGYNLGIGQALAMGLPVIASDIEAHREFPITTSNSTIEVCAALADAIRTWAEGRSERRVFLEPWEPPLALFCDTIEADCAADSGWA